jgi:beta-fructofuranosidase
MSLRYRSDNNRMVADIIPFFDNDYYHVFYLKGHSDQTGWSRHQTPWGHLRSNNLKDWEQLPEAIFPGAINEPDGGACFTGSVIRKDEVINIFYTGFNPGLPSGREQIMLASSRDGINFVKYAMNPILLPDNIIYGYDEDFRDPYVFWNEEEQCYWMLFTSGEMNPVCGVRRGVIGLAVSNDLMTWNFKEPIYAPKKYPSMECPDLFRIGDWWYLLFSQFGRTEYRKSRSLFGPWETPSSPYFDVGNYFFYAAKTFFDGSRRFLLGWCGDLANNQDSSSALWGGALVTPREVHQVKNGDLILLCPEEFNQELTQQIQEQSLYIVSGEWDWNSPTLCSKSKYGFSSILHTDKTGISLSLKFRLIFESSFGQAGFVIRSMKDLSSCYIIGIDFGLTTMFIEKQQSISVFHGSALKHPIKICERDLPFLRDLPIDFLVFLNDDILEVFVQGITFTVPLADVHEGMFGFFTCDNDARFENITFQFH